MKELNVFVFRILKIQINQRRSFKTNNMTGTKIVFSVHYHVRIVRFNTVRHISG